jgi:hypothetical protein
MVHRTKEIDGGARMTALQQRRTQALDLEADRASKYHNGADTVVVSFRVTRALRDAWLEAVNNKTGDTAGRLGPACIEAINRELLRERSGSKNTGDAI